MREIRYDVADGVATVKIDRPGKRNAMTYAMLAEYAAAVRRASDDPDVRALLITGVPGSFCAGIDLADLTGRSPAQAAGLRRPDRRSPRPPGRHPYGTGRVRRLRRPR